MKRSQLLAASIVALMVLSAIPVQSALAATGYTEKLNVYVAGSDALWYFTFGGVNGSSKLSALESTPGLSWYNVTAIKTTGWSSDFQIFGSRGYDLLPVPFVPSQGLFLSVGSDSYADAASAASALDSYLATSFTSLSNGTGTYTFYSPVSFSDLVPLTLLRFLPSTEGGFAQAVSSASFLSLSSPFVVLEGTKSSSGFAHSLVVGSITSSALSNGQPAVLSYFGTSPTFLAASAQSSSSVVQVTSLDGELQSKDSGAVVRNAQQFSGSYTLALSPGKHLYKLNATVAEQPAPLLATRAVDVGVLSTGGNISVTLTFRDLSSAETISSLSFTDNWWNKTGVFQLVSSGASDSVSSVSLAPGASLTPVYRLRYTGTTAGSVTIPASVIRYQYTVNGVAFNATTALDPIRLSLGADDAVVYATLQPSGTLGKPVGSTQLLNMTVTNVGTRPASSVVVAGHSIAGLAQNGGTATVTVSQSALGFLGVNVTRSYSASYTGSTGAPLNATTNVISDVFSHASMNVGFPTLTTISSISSLADLRTNLTLTFSTANSGPRNVTSFSASASLPSGLGCGTITGKGLACSGGLLTISYPLLNASSTQKAYMKYNLTSPLDYLLEPFTLRWVTAGNNATGRSNAVAIPAGVVVSKTFNPSQLFGGMSSQVTLAATNSGPLPAYNATVASSVDSFDSVASAQVLTKTVASLAAGGNVTQSYVVALQQVSGTQTAYAATASFYFGGAPFSVSSSAPKLDVYAPLAASITTSPSTPEEGKNFTINILITNPTGVEVSNVVFTLPVPAGLSLSDLVGARISSGLLNITAATLGPHGNITASAAAVASSGITVPFQNAKLHFTYAGGRIAGTVPTSSGVAIGEDVLTRYIIPTAFILIAMFAVAFYVRKKAASVPASPK